MSGEEDHAENGDIDGMLGALERAEIRHHLSDTELNSYENYANEYIGYLKNILEKVSKEKDYKRKKKEEEEKKRKEEERKEEEEEERKRKEEEERKRKEEEERKRKEEESQRIMAVAAPAPLQSGIRTSIHINDVMKKLTNQKQIEILERVKRRDLDDQMYFVNFAKNERNNTPKYKALIGTFTILGTLNKAGVRSEYNVDLYNPDVYDPSKKIFNCDCPAHRFKSSGDNTVCKHISFIMCRVIGYVTEDFFTTHRLLKDEVNMIMDKMSAQREVIMTNIELNRMKDSCNTIDDTRDKMIIKKKVMNRDSYLNSNRPFNEEECPICFDNIEDNKHRINCPDCKKHVHKECMEIWLSRNKTCVHCRSDNWKHYTKCFVQNGSIELLE
jgi:hypothetical protein